MRYPSSAGGGTVGGMSATPQYEGDVTRGGRAITFRSSAKGRDDLWGGG